MTAEDNIEWGQFYLKHVKLACGWRFFVVLKGRKYARLIEVSTGESARISIEEFRETARICARRDRPNLTAARLYKVLRANARIYGRHKDKIVVEALTRLKAVA